IDEARGLLRETTPVVLIDRDDDRRTLPDAGQIWKTLGAPSGASEAVRRTLTRILRPGTLVFRVAPQDAPVP
ncbi:MAG: hypothetical protein AAF961_09500, partial [Planctomycetota bacterium]